MLAACLLLGLVVFLAMRLDPEPSPQEPVAVASSRPDRGRSTETTDTPERRGIRMRPRVSPQAGVSPTIRPAKELIGEAQRIFGQYEAARTTKFAEYLGDGQGRYLYVVEPPSTGEVWKVTGQIEELGKQVAPGQRTEFQSSMASEIKSYDPYGERGLKILMFTVPLERTGRMDAMWVAGGEPESIKESFESGETFRFMPVMGWQASEDGVTLDRFREMIVWEPE